MKEGVSKNINFLINANKQSDPRICPFCNKVVPKKKIELFGIIREVQPACKCEAEASAKEVERLENAGKQTGKKEFANNTGEKIRNATLDNYEVRPGSEKAYKAASEYLDRFEEMKEKSLMIYGDYGNGKTHLAAAIKNALGQQGKIVIFQSVPELLQKIRTTFNKDNRETEAQIMQYLLECDLLVLDDIGAEKATDWVRDVLFRIIDGRYRGMKPIFYTSNLKPSLLAEKIGERAFDRLIETTYIIENTASSYRIEKSRKEMNINNLID